ncbi:hypothetical protein EVC20_136 [Rhizobium phage RHph_Y2_17_1]|nr:hypothetical protein EVC19_136 [Rhizobium phage RHph_Y2_11]QIG75875.1 hypothetical protein EVC20_136 [Rhizobium phage RHph_Y2_17_1]
MANLFLITGTDPDDFQNDRGLVVSCHDAAAAFELWRQYYWQDDADDFAPYAGEIFDQDPGGETLRIWALKHDPFFTGVLEWHDHQCKCVGYVKPRSDS